MHHGHGRARDCLDIMRRMSQETGVLAAQGLRRETILADVLQGTRRDAQWYSFGANKTHGLRRKPGDKKRAIAAILNDPEWGRKPQTEIANHVGVDQSYVSRVASEVKSSSYDSHKMRDVTRNGRTFPMNTSNIGRKPEPDEPDDEQGTFYNLWKEETAPTVYNPSTVEHEAEIVGTFGEDDSEDAAVLDALGRMAVSQAIIPNGYLRWGLSGHHAPHEPGDGRPGAPGLTPGNHPG